MIELINKYNKLKSQKNDGLFKSLMNKISTWTTKIKTNHNLNRYEQKKHLKKVQCSMASMTVTVQNGTRPTQLDRQLHLNAFLAALEEAVDFNILEEWYAYKFLACRSNKSPGNGYSFYCLV